jgi:hypothetical protein
LFRDAIQEGKGLNEKVDILLYCIILFALSHYGDETGCLPGQNYLWIKILVKSYSQ